MPKNLQQSSQIAQIAKSDCNYTAKKKLLHKQRVRKSYEMPAKPRSGP
jgi:hypothetical protein